MAQWKRGALAACAAAAMIVPAASMAQATGGEESGGYIGAAFGQAKLNGGCDDVRSAFTSLGGTSTSCDDKDSGWKIFGGGRINRNLAIEGSIINWGEISGAGTVSGVPVTVTGEAQSFGVAAVGLLPLNERFTLFGKAGLLMTDTKVTARSGSVSASEDDSSTELHIGVGALFHLGKFAIRAEWERAQDTEIDMISIGVQFHF